MAHYHQRKNGKYAVVVELGKDPRTGKRKRLKRTVNTEEEAKQLIHELAYKVNQGEFAISANETLETYLLDWLKWKVHVKYREHTIEDYELFVKKHINPILGSTKLRELKSHQIRRFLAQKLENGRLDGKGGLSNRSVNYIYTILNEALSDAVKDETIKKNPCKVVDAPKSDNIKPNPLSKTQIKSLLDVCIDNNLAYELFFIDLNTGLRRSELVGIEWSSINFDEKSITVKSQLKRIKGEGLKITNYLKNTASHRKLIVSDTVIEMLKEIKERQKKNKEQWGNCYNEDFNIVFRHPDGSPITPNYATKLFREYADKADLYDFTLHHLRHTHCTILIEEGLDPKSVQARMGHRELTTTLKYYTAFTRQMEEKNAKATSDYFDTILSDGTKPGTK